MSSTGARVVSVGRDRKTGEITRSVIGGESDGVPAGYEGEDSPTTPRSPFMHINRGPKKIK